MTAWEHMEYIRAKERPTIRDYIPLIFDEFVECHGDRLYGDDGAIVGGIAFFQGIPVTVIGHVKGHDLKENQACNFAMAHPEGYRKALRLARQAEKFHRPIITFVDTAGAYCGVGAEERGQGEAIAKNLAEFSRLKTPICSIVLGEGGSGGALGIAVCDRLAMAEHAVYSVISPRGFASILWKDDSREKEAADIMHITAEDLVELGVAEDIISEPAGGAQTDPEEMAENISEYLKEVLPALMELPYEELLRKRYQKFRKVGSFTE